MASVDGRRSVIRPKTGASAQRRLAAVLFSDIVGYTALMAESEARGLRARERHRDLLRPLAARYHGNIVDETGDELLLVFPSDLDAVNCALAAQETLRDDPELTLRIGIHAGDVVFEKGRVYGDGVNVASRIRPLAEPGGIAVSEPVFDAIKNQPDVEGTSLGERQLKHVAHPIAVYTVAGSAGEPSRLPAVQRAPAFRWIALFLVLGLLGGLVYLALPPEPLPPPRIEQPTGPGPRSALAVLPFADLSPEGDQQYFADGLSEEIINALTRVRGLKVVARTSAFAFRGPDQDVRAVGTALGVGSVLEGSVRRDGERLRITAQLVDARDGFHLWSESFDRQLRDIFEIQGEIAGAVVEAVRSEVAVELPRRILVSRPPTDFRAYELYLRGRSLVVRRGDTEAMRNAVALFEEALSIDPHYAPAHAGLAEAYYALWWYQPPLERHEARWFDRSLESASTAVQLDPELAYAHVALGRALLHATDWSGATAALERAVELDPGSVQAHLSLGTLLMVRGDMTRAHDKLQRALRLDPLSGLVNYKLGQLMRCTRRPEEAIARLLWSLETNPHNRSARWDLSMAYDATGQDRRASEALLPGAPSSLRPLLRIVSRLFGTRAGVRLFHALGAWRSGEPCLGDPNVGVNLLAYLGEGEATLRCIEESIATGRLYDLIKVDPLFDPYRDDPRFQALLARVGLAD